MCVESDDKAKIPFGNRSHVIDTNARPHGRILTDVEAATSKDTAPKTKLAEALDHSYHVGSVYPSVNLFQTIPSRLEESWVREKVTAGIECCTDDEMFFRAGG
jgi:hypothetical protein